jgi:hypothetical protein
MASSKVSLHIPQDVSIHFPQQIPDHVAYHVSEDIYCSSRQLSEPGLPGVWTFYLDLHQLLAGLPGSWRMRPPPPHSGGFTFVCVNTSTTEYFTFFHFEQCAG